MTHARSPQKFKSALPALLAFAFAFLLWPAFALADSSSVFLREGLPWRLRLADSTGDFELKFRVSAYDSVFAVSFDGRDDHVDNEAMAVLEFEGMLTPKFRFTGSTRVGNDRTTRDDIPEHFYDPYDGYPYNKQSGSTRTWDIFNVSLEYDVPFGKLLAGIDYLELGVARHNHVILRGSEYRYRPWQDSSYRLQIPAPTPYFGYEFSVGPLTYTQLGAKLYHEKDLGKYMHTHRLEARLPAKVTVGVSEIVVYGSTVEAAGSNLNEDADSTGRDFEWSYMIPFVPFVFEEHFHGDKDNEALAFDLSVKTLRGWDFYGEMLWDDMKSPTEIFDDSWWGNKWAATVGVETIRKFFGTWFTWIFEYTRVEPWVYTHHKGAGYNYTSYGQSLGTDLGPNSQELYTSLEAEWEHFKVKLYASNVAKDTAFGSSLYDIHTPLDATDKEFLAEETTYRYRELGLEVSFAPWTWLWMKAGGSLYFGDYEGYRLEGAGGFAW